MAACFLTGYLTVSRPPSPLLFLTVSESLSPKGARAAVTAFTCSLQLTSCSKTFIMFVCGLGRGFLRSNVWPLERREKRASRGIVTLVHSSFWLSGAVITGTGGSHLCLGLGQRAKSAVNGKPVGEFGKMQAPRRNRFALSPH